MEAAEPKWTNGERDRQGIEGREIRDSCRTGLLSISLRKYVSTASPQRGPPPDLTESESKIRLTMGDQLLYEGGWKVEEELRSKVTRVRVAPQVKKIPGHAFFLCDKLIELQLNEGLQVIEEFAFEGCESLQNVAVPATLIELGRRAFARCSDLIELQLKEGVQVIGADAFHNCRALKNVTLPSSAIELRRGAFANCKALLEVNLNEGLQIIGDDAFYSCAALRSVTVPSTVTVLGESAFAYCSDLNELQLNEGLLVIGKRAFAECMALRSMTIPATVTELGQWAFAYCSNLRIALNEGLEVIGAYAFSHCLSLRRVTLASSVAELGKWAFYDCRNMAEMFLNDGLQTIGKGAFEGCMALRSVTVPSTVTELLNQEFVACGFEREEHGLLDREALDEMLFDEDGCVAFDGCPELRSIKISISWAVSERMARLPRECMLSVEERIHDLHRLELLQDGEVLACFPVVSQAEGGNDQLKVQDTNLETARSLHKVLQLIAFHELKESSILIELAIWKSIIDGATVAPRADCRVPIPDTAKSSIMDYCGFAGFLEPAIEG
ncbi:hypothetical protein THAOC_35908 [Thalassiosira oceanica]|uniref:Uncharacterized protein n=1 Tax=Thalassiosira oceanica TaxID=159749 RepID=K0R2N1_THAOC|nr:hypothetical protein THAOC_35908 [Thalassiosira oceanica]|eukprot:EJK45474.1 hypothetical protein THAOC_35908 [Thalassiosira oceanica]